MLALGAVLVLASGCGDQRPGDVATSPTAPVASPTAVPAAVGRVATTERVLVSDDGSGPRMCTSGSSDLMGPPGCDAFAVTGWDWEAVGPSETEDGVRWGSYAVTGTFDGTTFAVEEATQPQPRSGAWDFEIPCATPKGGWEVVDPALTTQESYDEIGAVAEGLDGFAVAAVSTPDGAPGPRDPSDTVVSVYVASDARAAEAELRRHWGGMLCVTEVEHSHAELERVQQALLDVPGVSQVGSGNLDNQVELVVFHDDGSIQRWADQEFGAGVVVVESMVQQLD